MSENVQPTPENDSALAQLGNLTRRELKELEEKLIVHNFFRCAKGYLVNMNHVEGIVGSDCVIHSVHIPVSRTRKKEFMNKLLQNLNMD